MILLKLENKILVFKMTYIINKYLYKIRIKMKWVFKKIIKNTQQNWNKNNLKIKIWNIKNNMMNQ
jgi:hypothetical protein